MIKRPKDLIEAIVFLLKEKSWNEDGINEFKNEEPAVYHHTTGRRLRNNWGLWDENSDLHKFFNSIGIYHADDMSGIILETVHRILNGKPVDLIGQVNHYKKYWANMNCDMKGNPL